MGISIPLLTKILETNQLVKGRLNVTHSDLNKLYTSLKKDDEILTKKLSQQEKLIENNIRKRNEIKLERKRNYDTLQKSFYPTNSKTSLLYKKQGSSYYIKARFYWEGKQREVQVGSIPIVIEIINNLIVNKILTDIKQIKISNLSWEQISKRPTLIVAIKTIASLKAQEYIFRRLLSNELKLENVSESPEEETTVSEVEEMIKKNEDISIEVEKRDEDIRGVEWYENWREENL